jgi:SAM-dependent methyltransferase
MSTATTASVSLEATAWAVLAHMPPLTRELEAFTPWDNIPWEAQAEQLLRCRLGDGFIGLRPPQRVDREVAGLIERLKPAPGATILDLGCGPGLHGNRLGARGYRVTGIDIAQPVVDYAQAQADAAGLPCRYQRGSFLEMSFHEEFTAAFLANSTFNHLDEPALTELLRRIRRALVPGGTFACEVYVVPAEPAAPATPEIRQLLSLPYSPWSDRPHHWLERILSFPAQHQRVTHHVILGEDGSVRQHWSRLRLHDRHELGARLEACGLTVRGWFDYDLRSPIDPASDQAWVVVERPRAEAST